MGSVSSVNPGLTDLFQTLSNVNSPLLSSLATSSVLKNASPTDIVQLSEAATQLEGVNELFGFSGSSSDSSPANMNSFFANLEASIAAPAATPTTVPPADQLANYQSAMQGAMVEGLLGAGAAG